MIPPVNPDAGTPAVPPDDAAARAHDDHTAGRRDVPKPPGTANDGESLGARDIAERPGTADDATSWAQADGAWSHGAIHDDGPTGATERMMAAMRLAAGRRRDEPDPDRHHRDPWGRSVHELHGTPSAQSTKRNLKPCAFPRLPVFDERKIRTE
jgi:hypothetical protein